MLPLEPRACAGAALLCIHLPRFNRARDHDLFTDKPRPLHRQLPAIHHHVVKVLLVCGLDLPRHLHRRDLLTHLRMGSLLLEGLRQPRGLPYRPRIDCHVRCSSRHCSSALLVGPFAQPLSALPPALPPLPASCRLSPRAAAQERVRRLRQQQGTLQSTFPVFWSGVPICSNMLL